MSCFVDNSRFVALESFFFSYAINDFICSGANLNIRRVEIFVPASAVSRALFYYHTHTNFNFIVNCKISHYNMLS